MKSLTTDLRFGLAITALAITLAGCASRGQEQTGAATIGAQMQKNGVMSQADYIRIRDLEHNVSQSHAMSDVDLNYTLDLIKNSNNAIPRARAMTALSEISPVSGDQRAKIEPVIAPFLAGNNQLDRMGAERVQKALQSGR